LELLGDELQRTQKIIKNALRNRPQEFTQQPISVKT
jgi:hypothetical protein